MMPMMMSMMMMMMMVVMMMIMMTTGAGSDHSGHRPSTSGANTHQAGSSRSRVGRDFVLFLSVGAGSVMVKMMQATTSKQGTLDSTQDQGAPCPAGGTLGPHTELHKTWMDDALVKALLQHQCVTLSENGREVNFQ